MSVTAYVFEGATAPAPSLASDFGTSLAIDLWDLTEEVRACVSLDGDAWDYERSLFRFTPEQRQLFAGLSYLDTVEKHGHEAYFQSSMSFGLEDAVACFQACGSHAVADAIKEAAMTKTAPSIWADGAVLKRSSGLDHLDAAVIQQNPLNALRAFVRRHAASFERW